MLTKELKKSNDNLAVHGKIIIYLSTNISQPIQNPGHPAANSPALNVTEDPIGSSSSSNLAGTGASSLSGRPANLSHTDSSSSPARIQSPSPALASAPSSVAQPLATSTPQSPVVQQSSAGGGGAVVSHASGQAAASNVATAASANPAAASANRNFDPHSDQHGPLPGNWERRMDHLGRQYCQSCFVDRVAKLHQRDRLR